MGVRQCGVLVRPDRDVLGDLTSAEPRLAVEMQYMIHACSPEASEATRAYLVVISCAVLQRGGKLLQIDVSPREGPSCSRGQP